MVNRRETMIGLGVLGSLLLGGFSPASAEQPDWAKGPLKKPLSEVKIGFSSLGIGINGYTSIFYETIKNRAKELGVQLLILDAGVDPALQAQQIPTLITQKVDVALVWPVNSDAIVPSIKQLKAAGIPVVNVDTHVGKAARDDVVAFAGPDDLKQAQKAATLLVKALGGKGNVLVVTGPAGYDVTQQRIDGFKKAIEGSDIKVLDMQPADWSPDKAQSLMENWITRFGRDIDGVFSPDGGSASGVLNAVKAAVAEGKLDAGHIKFADPAIFATIYDAIIAGEYTGGAIQPPAEISLLGFDTAVKVAVGIEVPKEIIFDAPIVTKENITQYARPTW